MIKPLQRILTPLESSFLFLNHLYVKQNIFFLNNFYEILKNSNKKILLAKQKT